MIITRSPLRISLGGGGTDLPSYYKDHGGFLIAAAMDKYVYITLHRTFVEDIIIKYSKVERIRSANEIEHPIIREAIDLVGLKDTPPIEITSMADIHAGTGLGSSGSFTTALLRALYEYKREVVQTYDLAEKACHIEIDRLHEPIGKQDQYIAAFGGLRCFTFNRDGSVDIEPLAISDETLYELEDNLVLFYTGYSRKASSILSEQNTKTKAQDSDMIENLNYIKELGYRTKEVLEQGKLSLFGEIMHEHWMHKKRRSNNMTNPRIDELYELAMKSGAIGGKLIGAGGGGFLMFFCNDKAKLRKTFAKEGLREVRFRIDNEGTKVMVHD